MTTCWSPPPPIRLCRRPTGVNRFRFWSPAHFVTRIPSHPPSLPVVFLQRGRGMGLHAGRRKAPTGHSRRKQRDGGRHWFPEHFRRDHRRSAHGCCALIFFFLAFVLSVTDSRLARRRLKTILTGHVRQIPAPLFLLKPTLSSPSPHTHFIGLLSDQPRLGHCGAVARVD